MISPSEYYVERLYPLQDGILNVIADCGTSFYLTGGTALSRAYYHHRYSDDLDFFVNADENYLPQVKLILAKLHEAGFCWDDKSAIKETYFHTVGVYGADQETLLKLDFIDDVPAHFGDFVQTAIFPKTDSPRNILSNKIGALFRYESKDVADIREIALHETIDWSEIICEARAKENGLEIPMICEILKGMPTEEINNIKWIKNPAMSVFMEDIDRIVFDLLSLR